LTVEVPAVVIVAVDEAAGLFQVDETQTRPGVATQRLFDVGARFRDITSLVTQM